MSSPEQRRTRTAASHLHLRTLPSPTAAPPAHNTPSQRSPLLGAVNMPSPTAADPLMQNTPSQGRRSHPRVIAIDSNSDDDSSPTPNAWVHKGPVSAEEWAEVSDLFFDDIDSQSLPDLAAGMAEVSMDNNGQRTLKASTGHSDWAHVAEELVGDAFENAREVAIRRAPVQLEPTAEGATERKDRKVAYVVYHGRSVGVFYNWGAASNAISQFKGSRFDSFYTKEAAKEAWRHAVSTGAVGAPPNLETAQHLADVSTRVARPPPPLPTPRTPSPPANLHAQGLQPSRPGLTTCRSSQHPSRTHTRSGILIQWPERPFMFDGRPFASPAVPSPGPSITPAPQPEVPAPPSYLPTAAAAFPLAAAAHAGPASAAAAHTRPASASAARTTPASASPATTHNVPAYNLPATTHTANYRRQHETPGHASPLPRPRPPVAVPTQATAHPSHGPLPPSLTTARTAGCGQLDAADAWWVVVRGQRPGVYRGSVRAREALGTVAQPLLEWAASQAEADRLFAARYMEGEVVVCPPRLY